METQETVIVIPDKQYNNIPPEGVKREPNICFKIWHILNTVVFSLIVMTWVGYEFDVFRINTVVTSVHPGAGSCYAPNSPTWDTCD
jgi:hypothetical protein